MEKKTKKIALIVCVIVCVIILIIGSWELLLVIPQSSNEKNKFVGTWKTPEPDSFYYGGNYIMFMSNGTFKTGTLFNSVLAWNILRGTWDIKDGKIAMTYETVLNNLECTYQFSNDIRTLTLTEIDNGRSWIYTKQ